MSYELQARRKVLLMSNKGRLALGLLGLFRCAPGQLSDVSFWFTVPVSTLDGVPFLRLLLFYVALQVACFLVLIAAVLFLGVVGLAAARPLLVDLFFGVMTANHWIVVIYGNYRAFRNFFLRLAP